MGNQPQGYVVMLNWAGARLWEKAGQSGDEITSVAAATALPARALEPFSADYEASYMGLSAKGRMSIEPQAGNQWKYTLKVSNQVAQLTQVTVFEDRNGQWRPLSGTDASLLLVKKIRRNAVYDWASGQARWSGDVNEVIRRINRLGYGLTLGIQTRIDSRAERQIGRASCRERVSSPV